MYGPPDSFYYTLAALAIVGATFGLWKIIELVIWLFSHIS